MKYLLLFPLVIMFHLDTQAQKNSCDIAYRFDASYTNSLDQLEAVSIKLFQEKQTKESTQLIKAGSNFYYATGAASTKQFFSVDANIGFKICYIQPTLELYKAEVKNGMRTFTIPAGSNGNNAVNIPIQVITPPGIADPNRNGAMLWGKGNFKVKFVNGYLSQGEYLLIDKNSISADGTQMKGYAFSIK